MKKLAIIVASVTVFALLVFYSEDLVSGDGLVQVLPLGRSLLLSQEMQPTVPSLATFLRDSDRAQNDSLNFLENYDVLISDHRIHYNPPSAANAWRRNLSVASAAPGGLLKVHVVMHSHVDPGWLQTFEDYYVTKVKAILSHTVAQLTEHKDLRFIWSEMSFLERWWRDATPVEREQARKLVAEGRLELSGGAWVMTDEATPYFWATVDNYVEGHWFVRETFNTTPVTSWSVDPFGHGLMVPYILADSGVKNMVIGRLNADIKKELRENGLLLFEWAQPWDASGKLATPLVYALPRTYYTTSDSCGPDTHVCCKFDLGPSARSYCGQRANNIDDKNVQQFADELAGQYRQLAPFYATDALLVPVGDDFFYSQTDDWTLTHRNYRKLFDHINAHPERYGMQAEFSTVAEYFADARAQMEQQGVKAPLLAGDFFPYTEDKRGNWPYWTGFFVHRPHFKRTERLTQSKLRASDIVSVLGHYPAVAEKMRTARRDLALCQHHDSITGTSKPHVMTDYEKRLAAAFAGIDRALSETIAKSVVPNGESVSLLTYPTNSADGETTQRTIVFTHDKQNHEVLLISQSTLEQRQKISLRVNDVRVAVLSQEQFVPAQIVPVLDIKSGFLANNTFELVFYVEFRPLEQKRIRLELGNEQPKSTIISTVFSNQTQPSVFPRQSLNATNTFSLSNSRFSVQLVDGYLASLRRSGDNDSLALRVTYDSYRDRGGAYTFVSLGAGSGMHTGQIPTAVFKPLFIVGPLVSKAFTRVSAALVQTVVIDDGQGLSDYAVGLELFSNDGDMDATQVMDVRTDIGFGAAGEFYSDVNGLYFLRRRVNAQVPLEGNFYPVASGVFVQDDAHRFTVVTGQPTGATVTKNGSLELMLDRRLSGEDGKGLGPGDAADSKPVQLKFQLLLEPRHTPSANTTHPSVFHSAVGYFSAQNLLYGPELQLFSKPAVLPEVPPPLPAGTRWPCDVELVNVRFVSATEGLILLRRLPFDASLPQLECAVGDYKSLLDVLSVLTGQKPLLHSSLTGAIEHVEEGVDATRLAALLSVPLRLVAFKFVVDG